MECRVGCAACCIDISISTPIPGMPGGKPAGVRCTHLSGDNRCKLFGKSERPKVCISFAPSRDICGQCNDEAHRILSELEISTRPGF